MSARYSLEAAFIRWLRDKGYNAYSNVPETRPARFVTVMRRAGGAADFIDFPELTVQTWAATRADALDDAAVLRAQVVRASHDGTLPDGVRSATVTDMGYSPDAPAGVQGYQLLVEAVARME